MTNIYFGQNAELSLISRSHGRFSLGYCESFEVEPQHTQKKLYFFNKKEALPISILEGGAGRFGYLESEELYILGTLLDKNVREMDVINDDPAAYQEFHLMMNAKNQFGVLDMGVLVKRAKAAGNPSGMTPRDEQHGTFGFQCATRYLIKGAAIGYARILQSTPDPLLTTTDDDVTAAQAAPGDPWIADLPSTPVMINIEDAKTERLYFYVLKNGDEVKTGFTVTDAPTPQISIPEAEFAAGDVYELFYAYKPV